MSRTKGSIGPIQIQWYLIRFGGYGLETIFMSSSSIHHEKKIEEWVTKFNQSPNVTVKYVKGDHHYFVEEERAAETAGLINDFIK